MTNLDWPDELPRTDPEERRRYPHGFQVSMERAFRHIAKQLQRMDVDDYRIRSGTDHKSTEPNLPYANAPNEPADPGVVARWTVDGDQYAAACDAWDNIRDNAQALAKYLDAKRALERYSVATAESEFSTARLPSNDAIVTQRPAHEVLGVSPDASEQEVTDAFRERVKEVHPDNGGTDEAFREVQHARQQLVEDGGEA